MDNIKSFCSKILFISNFNWNFCFIWRWFY